MRKVLTMVSGIAVCMLLGSVSAWCQGTAPAPEAARVANVAQVPAATDHPLIPVIRWAERERPKIALVKDYTAQMQKQENINGVLQGAQILEVKVRHEPFSVYTKFRFPRNLDGQQAVYVKGQNDDKLFGHGVGLLKAFGTQKLDPEHPLAMNGHKYPITEMGLLNLVDKLLEVGYKDMQYGECQVMYTEGATVGKDDTLRECTEIRVIHPERRPHFMFHVARIFVDKELNMPIRYESFDWPRKPGEVPQLIESYQYLNLKLNVGLTDADFDHKNPAYAFP